MEHNNREILMKQLNLQKRQCEQVLQQLMKNQKEYNDYVYDGTSGTSLITHNAKSRRIETIVSLKRKPGSLRK